MVDISDLASSIIDEVLAEIEDKGNELNLTDDDVADIHECVVSVITDKLEEEKERN